MGYFLFGLAGGFFGGMGMGGGTVLIPLLSCFAGVNQHTAQAINLISFIPMSVIALVIHFKNGLVNVKGIAFIILPALVGALLGSVFSSLISGDVLRRIFGVFLIVLSVVQFLQKAKSCKKYK